jgi:hypothetical protein
VHNVCLIFQIVDNKYILYEWNKYLILVDELFSVQSSGQGSQPLHIGQLKINFQMLCIQGVSIDNYWSWAKCVRTSATRPREDFTGEAMN